MVAPGNYSGGKNLKQEVCSLQKNTGNLQIGENLVVPSGVRTVDAYGQLVIPGGVDANTNLHAPQKGLNPIDDFYQGTRAAVFGGTTTISQIITNILSILINQLLSRDSSNDKRGCVYSGPCAGGAGD